MSRSSRKTRYQKAAVFYRLGLLTSFCLHVAKEWFITKMLGDAGSIKAQSIINDCACERSRQLLVINAVGSNRRPLPGYVYIYRVLMLEVD